MDVIAMCYYVYVLIYIFLPLIICFHTGSTANKFGCTMYWSVIFHLSTQWFQFTDCSEIWGILIKPASKQEPPRCQNVCFLHVEHIYQTILMISFLCAFKNSLYIVCQHILFGSYCFQDIRDQYRECRISILSKFVIVFFH